MFFPKDGETTKFDYAVYAAASLIELLKKQRDAVGLSIFSDKLELHTAAKSSLAHHRFLYSELERRMQHYSPETAKTTNTIESLHAIAELTHKRSLIVLFSDLLDDPARMDEFFQAIQHMKHNKHEVVLFHVMDKKLELDFELENRPYNLVDMETGESIKLQPAEFKEQYKTSIEAYFNELKMRCINYKIDFHPIDLNEDLNAVLVNYMLKRSKLF
jgi:uncharacterized protein (DUF58 family)